MRRAKASKSKGPVVSRKLVAAYRFNPQRGVDEEYAVSVDGELTGPWANTAPSAEIKIDQIDRVVFFRDDQQFLLVDLVPEPASGDQAKGSWIKWIPNSDNGRVEIDAKVRCFLLNSSVTEASCLNLSARIRKIKAAEEFKFRVTTVENRSLINSDSYTPNLEQAISRANTVIDTISRDNGFTREIGLEIGNILPNPRIRVRFLKDNFPHYVLRFEGEINTRSRNLQTFDREGKFEFPFRTITVFQYPSKHFDLNSKIFPGTSQPASRWIVRLNKLTAEDAVKYWNGFASQHYDSLLNLQGGLPVSFLPAFDDPDSVMKGKSWALSYFIADASRRDDESNLEYVFLNPSSGVSAKTDAITISALRLQQAEDQTLKSFFGQLRKHDERPLSSQLNLAAASETSFEEDDRGVVISFERPIGIGQTKETTSVRMGALDLEFGDFGKQSSGDSPKTSFRLLPHQQLFEVHVDAVFAVADIRAGGQDDIPGEEFVPEGSATSDIEQCLSTLNDQSVLGKIETVINNAEQLKLQLREVGENELEARFRRQRPLVIDSQGTLQNVAHQSGEKPRYLLTVDEDAQKGSSHTIRLKLLAIPQDSSTQPEKPFSKEAIVLDSEPFLVGKVRYNSLTPVAGKGIEIGNWTNAGIEGTNWQLRSESKPFQLILPPQGIGEEMEKAKNIAEGQPIDYRLSPPARVRLLASENPQNFTEPPWNLRRILGFPGQRAPGATIKHVQFELIYGLSCDSSFPFLRLAEIFSLVGAIQGRLPKQARSNELENLNDEELKKLYYKLARLEWATLFRRYLSRIAILEPWDSHQPEHLLLSKDTVCRIRKNADPQNEVPAADLQPPVDVSPPTPTPTPTPSPSPSPTPVTCPTPVPTPPLPTPPLLKGGVTWGFESKNVYNAVMRVKSGEVNPSTDDAEVNDLYLSAFGGWGSIKAPFDNKKSTIYADVAMGRTYKYKIERIGRIACWWNIAKHVIVYERTVVPSRQMNDLQNQLRGRPILRKVEEYVEILEDTRNYPDGDNPESDLLKQQRGFVKACSFSKGAKFNVLSSWGADVGDIGWKVPLWNPSAGPADVYPKPKVHLQLMSATGERSSPAPALIANPENLFFYTETREGSTRSPNGWAPVKNVDYVDLPKPQPLTDFQDGKNQQTTPNDPAVHPGFSLCTFTLEANGVPTDMVAARVGKPLAAVVETVTMMRARLKDATTSDELPDRIVNLRKSVADAFQDLLRIIPSDEAATQNQLVSIRNAVRNRATERFIQIKGDIRAFETDLANRKEEIFAKLKSYESGVFDRIKTRLTLNRPGADSIVTVVKTRYDDILNIPDLEAAKRATRENLRFLQEAILLLNASPGILVKSFRQYVEAYLQWGEESGTIILAFTAGVDLSTPGNLTGEQLRNFKAAVQSLLQLAQSLDQRIKNGLLRPVDPLIPDPLEKLEADYFSAIRNDWQTKERALRDALAANGSFPKSAAKEIADFFTGTWQANDGFTELRLFVAGFPDAAPLFAYLAEADLADDPRQGLKGWIGEQLNEVENATSIEQLRAAVRNRLIPRITGDETLERSLLWHLKLIKDHLLTEDDAKELFELAFGSLNELLAKLKRLVDDLETKIGNITADIRKRLEGLRDEIVGGAEAFIEKHVRSVLPDEALKFASPDSVARLVRAFGHPPEVPNLGFDRERVAYFYKELDQAIGLTPVLSRVKQASAVADELKSIGIALPTERILDKLVPPDLSNFSLSEILPNVAGMDLSNLFSGLKMPEMGNDNVKVMHGFDPQSRRAWVESKVGVEIREPATVFSIGPVTLSLTSALFAAEVRFEAAPNEPPKRLVKGRIRGTWELIIGSIALVRFRDTELRFDDSGNFRFDISPLNVELPDILSFVSEFLKSFSSPDSGFSIGLTPKGVQALLNLPIPDIQAGAFGISNLVLGMAFGLDFTSGFKIYLSFSLGRKEAPFALVIFILGGGGFIEQVTEYTPATGAITSTVSVGVTACASLAIALGPIKGGVFVYFGVFANLALSNHADQNQGLTIGVMFLIRGEVNVLGIAYACVSLLLEATYRNGELTGRGKLSIKIKICWCFTLKIEKQVEYKLGGGGSGQNRELERRNNARAGQIRKESASPRFIKAGYWQPLEAAPLTVDDVDYALDYIEMLS